MSLNLITMGQRSCQPCCMVWLFIQGLVVFFWLHTVRGNNVFPFTDYPFPFFTLGSVRKSQMPFLLNKELGVKVKLSLPHRGMFTARSIKSIRFNSILQQMRTNFSSISL